MPDFAKFSLEASRVLKPKAKLAIFAWLQPDVTKPWMINSLLQPLCDEGCMRMDHLHPSRCDQNINEKKISKIYLFKK